MASCSIFLAWVLLSPRKASLRAASGFAAPSSLVRAPAPVVVLSSEPPVVEGSVSLESEDAHAWVEERREYQAIAKQAPPRGLAKYVDSYATKGKGYFHRFEVPTDTLAEYRAWETCSESKTLSSVVDLLDAVAYLHERGLPHLSLNSRSVYLGDDGLRLVGAGSGPKLVATKRPVALPEDWPFNPPETLTASVLIQSNLRALFCMDAWSVGVLVVMLATKSNQSPLAASADWRKGVFDERGAVAKKTAELLQANLASFLKDGLGKGSEGLVFKHGFLLQVVLGLLETNPHLRMSVSEARNIARDWKQATTARYLAAAGKRTTELGRFGPNVTVGGPAEKGASSSAAGKEPFRSLEAIVNVIELGACECVLEDRHAIFGPLIIYGEIIGYRNRGDGDRWDVIVPGVDHSSELRAGETFRIRRVLGVVLVKGGNHKLAVELEGFTPTSRARVQEDVSSFIRAYVASKPHLVKSRVRFLEYGKRS